jgi:hypothetical protein
LIVSGGSSGPKPALTPIQSYGVGLALIAVLVIAAVVAVRSRSRRRGASPVENAGPTNPYRAAARGVRPGGGATPPANGPSDGDRTVGARPSAPEADSDDPLSGLV